MDMQTRETKQEKISYEIMLLLFSIINLLAGIAVIATLPSRVAVHFNVAFEADSFGSPWMYLVMFFVPPLVAAGLIAEIKFRKNGQNRKTLRIILSAIVLMFVYLSWVCVALGGSASEEGQKVEVPLSLLFCFPIGAIFLVMGNYLPTVRRNKTLGIRTKATLSSDFVWRQTHRVMGRVWVAIGLLEILCSVADALLGVKFLALMWLAIGVVGNFVVLPFVTKHFKNIEKKS